MGVGMDVDVDVDMREDGSQEGFLLPLLIPQGPSASASVKRATKAGARDQEISRRLGRAPSPFDAVSVCASDATTALTCRSLLVA